MDSYKPPPPIEPDDQPAPMIDRFLPWHDRGTATNDPLVFLVKLLVLGIVFAAILWLIDLRIGLSEQTD